MESLPQGREALAAHSWGTRMHAKETWRHSTSTSIPGRTSPLTTPAGEACFTNSCSPVKRSWQWWQQRSEPTKRKWQPTDQSQCTDVTYVTEIVTLTLVSTATGGTAQAEQTAWTSNGWIIIIHGQPWPMEAYWTSLYQIPRGECIQKEQAIVWDCECDDAEGNLQIHPHFSICQFFETIQITYQCMYFGIWSIPASKSGWGWSGHRLCM